MSIGNTAKVPTYQYSFSISENFFIHSECPFLGPVCTPEVEGVDCPIYCCALQELPIQEVTSESSGAVTDNDYIENEASSHFKSVNHLHNK